MAKPKTKRPRVGANRVKGVASRGFFRRRRWVLIGFVILLFIPAMQVAVVRFVNPPVTLPMLIDQAGGTPLRYRWIDLPQIPEMFLSTFGFRKISYRRRVPHGFPTAGDVPSQVERIES